MRAAVRAVNSSYSGRCTYARADGGGPGERDHRHVRVGHEVLPGLLPGAGDDVEDAVGDPGGRGGLGEEEGGQRGELRGLEDEGVARGDGREDLPGGHLQRVVPGRDGADDADGFAAHVRGVVAGVLPRGQALRVAGGTREEGGVVDGAGDVELAGQFERLAALQGLDTGQLVGAVGEDGGEAVQRLGALARGGAGPPREGGAGGGDGTVDVGGAGEREAVDLLAGGRVDHGVLPARGAVRGGAGDVLGTARETFPHVAQGTGAETAGGVFGEVPGALARVVLGALSGAIPGVVFGVVHAALLRVPATEPTWPNLDVGADPGRTEGPQQVIPLFPFGYATESVG
jgi:hypothetical protein